VIRFDLAGERIELAADAEDAAALTRLAGQFTGLLGASAATAEHAPATDPALRRLLPDPVQDDPEESEEVRGLTAVALVEHKRANAERVAATLARPGALEPRDELAWLQWLTDIRLVLAARLGILVDGDEGLVETEEQRAMGWTYHALGALQAELLELLDERAAQRAGS